MKKSSGKTSDTYEELGSGGKSPGRSPAPETLHHIFQPHQKAADCFAATDPWRRVTQNTADFKQK